MTPEMAFECLLVSPDPTSFSPMYPVLTDLAITTNLCASPSEAADFLKEGSTDLIVIDWENSRCSPLLELIGKSALMPKPTVVAVVADDCEISGVHVLVRKPVTQASGAQSLQVAYSRMLRDYRRYVRYAVMGSVQVTDQSGRSFQAIVTNIGAGGVGLSTRDRITVGDVVSFRLLLPGEVKEARIEARVLWTRQYGAAGCEFTRISAADEGLIQNWLDSKCRIRKPLVREYRLDRSNEP